MTPFRTFTGRSVPLPIADVDTDKIIPGRFLSTVSRSGLGRHLFDGLRYDENGRERPEFVLNRALFRDASVLVTLENFGCGSSREHAVWALMDFGVRCVVAPSFADIFMGNAVRNGLLLARTGTANLTRLLQRAEEAALVTVDLENQVLGVPSLGVIHFAIDAAQRAALLSGEDEINRTDKAESAIAAHERQSDRIAIPIRI
ncbi:3-isopropylmalate dehydratase small subunit [uncultured Sphingomonas sp.]|uniref:3-isopropylmalate dehydratase small subunit n=1 Tax=uncultured Sphingomonas sp. TaxID=158754 RepID=UPI0035C97EA9